MTDSIEKEVEEVKQDREVQRALRHATSADPTEKPAVSSDACGPT